MRESVLGSYETYRARLVPVLIKALEARGFLPYRDASPWKSAWQRALYRLRLEVNERREGNYLSSPNRLTRIESRLTLTTGERVVWQTMPTARTTVPLPGLPAYQTVRAELKRDRSEELERLLYENAPRPNREQVQPGPQSHARMLPVTQKILDSRGRDGRPRRDVTAREGVRHEKR